MVLVYLEMELCLFWAFLLMTLPLPWLLSAIFAALWHELCHLMTVVIFGGSVKRITIGLIGTRIEADVPDGRAEGASILAGPIGSLALFLTYFWRPQLAVCGIVQGIYNLMPFKTLDGGRMADLLRMSFCR